MSTNLFEGQCGECVPSHGRVSPPHMLGQGFLAGVEFVAKGALVLLFLKGSVTGMFLLVHGQVRLGGVALKTDVTLEWFLSRVHAGVTLIFAWKTKPHLIRRRCVYITVAHRIVRLY